MRRPLGLDSPVREVDRGLAERRSGYRTKGPPAHQVLAESLGIVTVGDLLRHYPRRYIDRSATLRIGDLRAAGRAGQARLGEGAQSPAVRVGQEVTVIGRVSRVDQRRTRRGQQLVTVVLADGSGSLDLPFFNQPWIARTLRAGVEVAVSGRIGFYGGRLQLANQEVEVLRGAEPDPMHTGRITPVHAAAEGVTTRTIRELMHHALRALEVVEDPLPPELIAAEALIPEDDALRWIHFPEDQEALRRAVDRLKFDELFALELGVAYRKHRVAATAAGVAHRSDGPVTERFLATLPFEPTGAQRRVMKEISEDMAESRPMNRLLQGDVGSGKTMVALHAALVAAQSGHQATIMAPTEVLAGQHLRSVRALLAGVGVAEPAMSVGPQHGGAQGSLLDALDRAGKEAPTRPLVVSLLTASVTGQERQRVLAGVASGTVDLVVGTHALVQEGVEFADLSLVVVDEQHRFGVHQRVTLKEKGGHPDVLIMTATPIPRTLALTYYGDLDVSVLDEMPAGRRPVATRVARDAAARAAAYDLVRREVARGRQAFVVCAAIDEGNRAEVRAAEHEAERLRTEVFPELRIELLHGRMRPREKDAAMERFRAGQADVLISTTVVEVGVDVPGATVMLVENAERFGLAQLHQLRGRIGRGGHDSTCVLFDESAAGSGEARARLEALAGTTDGFALADEDLRLRGEGTLFDVRQSGLPDLKLAKLAEDTDLVGRARARAFAVIGEDPELAGHPELLGLLRRAFTGEAIEWLFHG